MKNEAFKKIVIFFWAIWWLIALWTDLVGGLAHLDILKKSWAPDLNYPFLEASLKMYSAPEGIIASLFIAILAWSLLSTLAFLWAALGTLTKNTKVWMQRAQVAFTISLTYWLAFFIADQLVMKYDLEQNHMVQGGFQLLTFLALYCLPNQQKEN